MSRRSVFHTWFLASVSPVALLPLNPDELLSTTRAVRKRLDFDKPVPDELIRECVSLAMQSPSGSNSMTMQFIIVKDEAKRKAIGAVYRECFSQYQAMDGVYIRTIDKGDELLVEAPEREAESVLACMQRVMEGAMQLDVPLKADGGIGHDWFEA